MFIYYKIGSRKPSLDGVVVHPLHSSKRWFQEGMEKGKKNLSKMTQFFRFIFGFSSSV
jgi:hypothetical protein